MIPYGRQDISQDDIDAVVAVLRSEFITQGPAVELFERTVAAYCGVPHAVAVNSATSALHVACIALGLGPGDRLWTSPNTFLASANAGAYCGAEVDFVDIDPRTYNMSVEALRAKLERAAREGRLPRVVVPVHFAGQSCEMAPIGELARRYGFRVIEDASHAIGAAYRGAPVGRCDFADIAVFSFHPVKIVTSGEGGVATTRDPELAGRMRLVRSHGMTRDPAQMTRAPEGPWDYEQIALGYNYRITDIQAALGASQMKRISDFVARRREIAERYDREFEGLLLVRPWQHPDTASSWHLYVVLVDPDRRRRAFEGLRAAGIGVNVHYIPVHTQPFYRERFGFAAGDFANAEAYYARAISLPMYAALTDAQQSQVVDAVRRVLA
ncbi:MAG: UDP-4-amino-4,6-dideoxy-N-acetyl-beta-L-altrosami ne transaminase [Betaproteobacteria bacterium]|nr:MAG: UDP-4-amino-4,6-dideoxy-N-acetyl-beta-L-altrosami ne transaminase [Betaproteobacteria bacterium]